FMPRTRIGDTSILDIVKISEFEFNEFFESVVITGTETETNLTQRFNEYFPGQGIIVAGSNITVTTGTTTVSIASTGGGGGGGEYSLIRDEKANGSDGGTFTQGAWRTRDLNTIVTSGTEGISLASNQFTLPAGTYRAWAYLPAHACFHHRARVQNITDGTTTLFGTPAFASNSASIVPNSGQFAQVAGEFTISSSKTFEVQHFCATTKATDGLGAGGTSSTSTNVEIFTYIELVKVA
ncbi:MAG: hypothetical protein V3T88_06880, partial [Nitrosomonadaceae bacterium]